MNYQNLNILKYISAILIVILHLRPFLNFSNELDLAFNNIVTRICVPIFFIITGYFAAKKEKDNEDYIKSYIKKTIPLYLTWSLLYVPVIIVTMIQHLPTINEYLAKINIALPLLQAITTDKREHAEAVRLINILKYFEPIPSEYIPANSLLKEFLGGGYFEY